MPKRTIKADFRWRYGYQQDHRCKECQHLVKSVANRTHYKCEKMGITASEATDIRLKDYACCLFEPERSEDESQN